jgi:hypothetical protein
MYAKKQIPYLRDRCLVSFMAALPSFKKSQKRVNRRKEKKTKKEEERSKEMVGRVVVLGG